VTSPMTAPVHNPTAIEVFPDPLLILHEDGTLIEVNAAAAELLDTERRLLIGRRIHEIVVADANTVSEHLAQWSRNGQLVSGSLNLRLSSGEEIKCRVEGARLGRPLGSANNPLLLRITPGIRASAAFVDLNDRLHRLHAEVAERKRVQHALEQSQRELKIERERLEEHVQERTRELMDVTAQLKHEIE
jgi:PAS domain-containing protein